MGRDHRPLPVSSRINTVINSGEGFSSVMLPWRNSTLQELALTVLCEGVYVTNTGLMATYGGQFTLTTPLLRLKVHTA
jgi:hypothetical protein